MNFKKASLIVFLLISSISCKYGNSDVSISSSSSEDIEESSSEYVDLYRDYDYNNGTLLKIKNIKIENNQITIPSSINGKTIKTIYSNVFSDFEFNNDKLITLIIPSSIIKIHNNAFSNCNFIEKVVFDSTSKLEEINEGVFSYCTNLKEIVFPTTLKKIEKDSFLECKSLTKIILPKTIKVISASAFYKCENLEGFYTDGESEYITIIDGVIYSKNRKTLRIYPYGKKEKTYKVLPEAYSINSEAFYSNPYLETIDLNNVKSIHSKAFFNCSNLKTICGQSLCNILYDNPFLLTKWYEEQPDFAKIGNCLIDYKGKEKIIDQNSLSDIKYISCNAFNETPIEEITIPSNVERIWQYAFINNHSLKKVTILSDCNVDSSVFKGNHPYLKVYVKNSLYNIYKDNPDYKNIDYSFIKITSNVTLNINGNIFYEALNYGDEYDFSNYLDNDNSCFIDEYNKYYPIKGIWENINTSLVLYLANNDKVKFVDKNYNLLFDYNLQNGDSYSINNNDILINNEVVYTLTNPQKYYKYTFKIDEDNSANGSFNNNFIIIQVEEIPIEYVVNIYKYRIGADNEVGIIPFTCRDIANRGFKHFLPPVDPNNEYDFEGFYLDENYTTKLENLYLLIDNKIEHLYAKWVEIE